MTREFLTEPPARSFVRRKKDHLTPQPSWISSKDRMEKPENGINDTPDLDLSGRTRPCTSFDAGPPEVP